jgi:flagellar biosynthesis anti-sigma factor FlgM
MRNPTETRTTAKIKRIQRTREITLSAPDIRADKVNDIRAEIAAGRFEVDSETVAGKMLQDILVNAKLSR